MITVDLRISNLHRVWLVLPVLGSRTVPPLRHSNSCVNRAGSDEQVCQHYYFFISTPTFELSLQTTQLNQTLSTMAGRGRGLAITATLGGVGAVYYLYTAGGNPKVAEKNMESRLP